MGCPEAPGTRGDRDMYDITVKTSAEIEYRTSDYHFLIVVDVCDGQVIHDTTITVETGVAYNQTIELSLDRAEILADDVKSMVERAKEVITALTEM
jgi:hypothetical protein